MSDIHTTQEELSTVVKRAVEEAFDRRTGRVPNHIGFLVGLEEISDFLHCSIPTARKRLETDLQPAVLSGFDGKTYLLDGDRALRLLQQNAERRRKAPQQPKTTKL